MGLSSTLGSPGWRSSLGISASWIFTFKSSRDYIKDPSWTPLPSPSPYHPSGSSQYTSPKHTVSCIEPGLVTHYIYVIIPVSMPFFQIIPPSSSPTETKRLFYTSVSLLLSRIQGYRYHLSKFHIYALVYCIGVFLGEGNNRPPHLPPEKSVCRSKSNS